MLANKLRSEKGNALTVAFLIILPLIVIFTIASLDHATAVFKADLDIQQALNDACRSAALCVDPLSQAYNNPMLEPDKAHEVFKKVLASNLGLNEDLTLNDTSSIKDINYRLFIVNGENDYGILQGKMYPSEMEFETSLPYTITQDDLGIEEEINIKLDSPGCIAIVTATLEPILGQQETTATRWSSAKILN
jgi:hypothetical protein